MSAPFFEQQILELNFFFLATPEKGGVLLVKSYEDLQKAISTPDVLFALEAAGKFGADAVYFRYFDDGRGAMPQLYFFDYTNKQLTDKERYFIQIRMWNGYQVPAYIIIEKSTVTIFDSREKPKDDKSNYANQIIELTGSAIRDFRASDFDDGLFWEEQDEQKHFKFEQSATRDLIRGLKEVYKSFQQKSKLDKHVALKLLVQSLLIKYLEERDEESASGYFAGTYFKKNFQCEDFCDTIRKGKILELLDQLAKDFNGKIFAWDVKSEKDERLAIQASEVQQLADYLDAKIQNNQYVIWRLYSFSHLPIEVISSVYEELLTDSKDIVYTPEMVVSTLVDECMPLKIPKHDFKLIDVSCGSGIFLVKAYKRIVQWWRYEQWQKTGILAKPSLAVLKDLLLKSIHGLDIQQDAIRLSIFSLALAILDEVNLDPPTWGKLRFPDLSENIITEDFFKYITKCSLGGFDLVIGNPPFNLQQVNGKEPSRKEYFKELKDRIGYQIEISIPDENPALHFLVQSMKLLKPNGNLSLIQPSGPLFYQKDTLFKRNIFSKYNLLQVIDFTKLADKLWGKTNVATVAVFLQNAEPDNVDVLHVVANRTFSNTNRLFLEFDHYDFHYVSKEAILSNPYVWKANLLGGGRIVQLIDRLSGMDTIEHFLESKKQKGWVKGEGFIENKAGKPLNYITNQPFLPTSAFTEKGIDYSKIIPCRVDKFHRKTSSKLFEGPHLLIRKILPPTSLIAEFIEKSLVFKSDILSIHAPESDSSDLKALSEFLKINGALLRFYILATSSRVRINKATSLYDEDILNIPYTENEQKIVVSSADQIIIEDALLYSFKNDSAEILKQYSSHENIIRFANTFCQPLNSVYASQGKAFQLLKILDSGNYYALHFVYSNEDIKTITEHPLKLETYIKEVIPRGNANKPGTHIQRIMKAYGQDSIILVKPKQLRYWLPSIALRDADESFADYIKARYHNA